MGQPLSIAIDACHQRLPRRQRENPFGRNTQDLRGRSSLRLYLGVDLSRRGQRIAQRVDLVEHHEGQALARAEVIAPDGQIGLGHTSVGAHDEHRGMGRRQQAQREFGLGTQRVQTRRVDHDQTLPEQRVRMVDQRMAPHRHLDPPGLVGPGVVVGARFMPQAEGLSFVDRHPTRGHHLAQGHAQRLGLRLVKRQMRPALAALTPLRERHVVEPRGDRQQRQALGLMRIPGQFDRAHGRAARRGGQHPDAGVGKEDRVDQLGLAARELGHERDDELVAVQALAQRREQRAARPVVEADVGQAGGQLIKPLAQRGAPVAQVVKAAGKGRRHGSGFQLRESVNDGGTHAHR